MNESTPTMMDDLREKREEAKAKRAQFLALVRERANLLKRDRRKRNKFHMPR